MLGCELYGSVLYGSQIAPPGVVIVAAWSVEADLYGAVVYGTARMAVEHHELGGRYVYVLQIDAPPAGKIDWLFDDVMLDASVLDEWDGCVRFTYQWTEQGPVLWRGPMYSGYQCPPAWELAGEMRWRRS